MLKLEYLVLVTVLVLSSAFQGTHSIAPAKRDAVPRNVHLANIIPPPHDHYMYGTLQPPPKHLTTPPTHYPKPRSLHDPEPPKDHPPPPPQPQKHPVPRDVRLPELPKRDPISPKHHKKDPAPRSAEHSESTQEDPIVPPKSHKDALPRLVGDTGNEHPPPEAVRHKKPAVRRSIEHLEPREKEPSDPARPPISIVSPPSRYRNPRPPVPPDVGHPVQPKMDLTPASKPHKRGLKPRSPRYPNYSGPVRSEHIKETLSKDLYGRK